MTYKIRLIKDTDIDAVLNIYASYIKETSITFENKQPSFEAFRERVKSITAFYPWLVFEENGAIYGYAYACSHRQREAYQWSVDVAIYLSPIAQSKGVGSALYSKLFDILKAQGFYNAYAGIALPNDKSIGLHEKFGFKKIAEYNKVGFKLGKWWNVGWWELALQDKSTSPSAPKNVNTLFIK